MLFNMYRDCVASSPGLPPLQFLIVCSMRKLEPGEGLGTRLEIVRVDCLLD